MTINDCEKFYAKIWKTGNTNVVSVPINFMKGRGWNDGSEVVVLVRDLLPEEIQKRKDNQEDKL